MVNILVNGVGAIGKRVAHAVKLQDDMKLVGISDAAPTFVLRTNLEPKGPLYKTDCYASGKEFLGNFKKAGFYVKGVMKDLLDSGIVDVVADCTPAGVEVKNKKMYEDAGVKVVYQGGAKPEVAGVSFSALANYDKAIGKKSARVVSCNTSSLVRTINLVDGLFKVKEVTASLIRRAVDPWNPKKGPINAIVPVLHVPSHHGPDVNTILPRLNITTMAVKVPTTLAHVHILHAEVKAKPDRNKLKRAFVKSPRITVLRGEDGYSSTAEVIERYRDLGRPRYDMPEVVVWEETITAKDDDLYWVHAVHSESIVVPETIDCIRALMSVEKNGLKSVRKTDKALGLT